VRKQPELSTPNLNENRCRASVKRSRDDASSKKAKIEPKHVLTARGQEEQNIKEEMKMMRFGMFFLYHR
jgi:hypothetical protein